MESESKIKKQIRLELSRYGIITIPTQVGNFLSMDGNRIINIGIPGMSDLMAIRPDGVVCWLETKCESGGKKSEKQKKFIEQMKKQNCKAGFCRSVYEALKICEVSTL